jgi:hypothetical protein
MNNPSSKNIDINAQEGLDLLKEKAKYYGHYAENLKMLELIEEIEKLRANIESMEETFLYISRN